MERINIVLVLLGVALTLSVYFNLDLSAESTNLENQINLQSQEIQEKDSLISLQQSTIDKLSHEVENLAATTKRLGDKKENVVTID